MTQAEILARLTELFREILDDDKLVLANETTAADVEHWDSVTHITIIIAIEQRFGIKFQTAETEILRNVGDMVDLISRKLSKAKA